MEKELINYCIKHMSSKSLIYNLYDKYQINYRMSDSYDKLASRLESSSIDSLNLDILKDYFRTNWKPTPLQLHLDNLKSGLLKGHNWHGAMPSMLHLSLQNKVREHIDGLLDLSELINIGADIMKHEYFMVAVHDLCETTIITSFDDIIPPIGNKSISDFVFKNIPYDLKITNYISDHSKEYVNNNKKDVAMQLLAGADIARLRKQAKKTIFNWGLNRFFILVKDQNRWNTDPEGILKEIVKEINNLDAPLDIRLGEFTFSVQLVAI